METFHQWLESRQGFIDRVGIYLAMRDQEWGAKERTLNAFEVLVEDLVSSGMWQEDYVAWQKHYAGEDIKELAMKAYPHYKRHMELSL